MVQIADRQVAGLLDALKDLEPILQQNSRRAEAEKRLPEPSVDALRDAGLYRMFRPEALGGYGLDPVSEFTVAEALARIDSSAAWNVQVCNASDLYGAWFSGETTSEVFGDGNTVVAGAFNPRRRATAVDGGYLLSGVTPFTSNCHGADWIMGLAEPHDGNEVRLDQAGNPVMLLTLVPAHECHIRENWDTMGLGGTGSHDLEISDVFVPEARAVPFTPSFGPSKAYDTAISRMAIWVTAASHAAVALGVAQAAIDDLVELGSKVPSYTVDTIASRARVQMRLAQAEAQLASARSFFHEVYQDAWSTAGCRGGLSMPQKARCQLATTHAVTSAAQAVDLVHSCVGTAGIRKSHNFEKYFRDVHVITQHAFVSEARLEAVGQIMFAREPDWPFFAF